MAEKISAKDFYGGVGDWIDIDPETGEEYVVAEVEAEEEAAMALLLSERGGEGSGHHGHAGIPGHQGGSLPGEAGQAGEDRPAGTPVSIRETLPEENPFSLYYGTGYSGMTFEDTYRRILRVYGDDTPAARYAAEVLRLKMERVNVLPNASDYLTSDASVAAAIQFNISQWLQENANANGDDNAEEVEDDVSDEEDSEPEIEPMPEFEASIQQAASGVYEVITEGFLTKAFQVTSEGEITYITDYVRAIARDTGKPPNPDSEDIDIGAERAAELRAVVEEYLTTIDSRFEETREKTGELTTSTAETDDLVVLSREVESEEWSGEATNIASSGIWQVLKGGDKYGNVVATVLRDGSNPVALLTTEPLTLPNDSGQTDFSPGDMQFIPEGKYLYVHYLASEERGKGYGTYLMTKALEMAATSGQGIFGGATVEAKPFYEKLGAKYVDRGQSGEAYGSLGMAYFTAEQVKTLYENMGSPVLKSQVVLDTNDEPANGVLFVSPSILARAFKRSQPVISPILRRLITKGGPGSGHFAHVGRPGERGGSLPGEVSQEHEPGILGNIMAGDKYKDYVGPSEERLHTAGLRSMAQGSETSPGIDKPTMVWAFNGLQDISRRWFEYNDKTGKVDRQGRPYNDYVAERFKKDLAAIGNEPTYENLLALHEAIWHAVQGQNPTVTKGPDFGRPNLAAPPGSGHRVVKYEAAEVSTPGPKGESAPYWTAHHGWSLYNGGRGVESWKAKREWDKEHGIP